MPTQSLNLTTSMLKALGFGHAIIGQGQSSGVMYKGAINANNEMAATQMIVRWDDGQLQVATKEKGALEWKFKGFGFITDEAHLHRLLGLQ